VYVSNNHFKRLPAMPFPRLRFLDASWNALENLPDAFHLCTSLETLELGYVRRRQAPTVSLPWLHAVTARLLCHTIFTPRLTPCFLLCASWTRCSHNVLMSLYIFNPVFIEEDPDLRIVVDDWETRKDPATKSVRVYRTPSCHRRQHCNLHVRAYSRPA
jgi:hypothetical protein